MSLKKQIIDSIMYYLKLDGIKSFVYADNTWEQPFDNNINSKVDLPLGTETTFIVQINGADFTADYDDFLLNRHISLNGVEKRIIAYDRLTGSITIESAFGLGILSSDIMSIIIKDSVFIYSGFEFDDRHGTNSAQLTYIQPYFTVKTKDDVRSIRNEEIIEQIKSTFYKRKFGLKIFDDETFTTNKGWTSLGTGSVFQVNPIDVKNNDYVNRTSILLGYYVNYK